MEEDIQSREAPNSRFKRVAVYAAIFIFGFFAASVFKGGSDKLKNTANLAAQTAGEVFLDRNQPSNSFVIPIKKTANQKKPVAPKSFPAAEVPKTPVVPPVTPGIGSSSATSSPEVASSPGSPSSSAPEAPKTIEQAATPMPQGEPSLSPATISAKLVFFEIQITGGPGLSERDFLKIYNPTPYPVDASGWKLKKRSKTGGESSIKVIPDGTVIPSGSVLTWANSKDNFSGTMNAEISSTASISADNSVAILDPNGSIIDAVAWGGGAGQFVEGSPYPTNPEAGQILRRKNGGANLQDTDNNSVDFSV